MEYIGLDNGSVGFDGIIIVGFIVSEEKRIVKVQFKVLARAITIF